MGRADCEFEERSGETSGSNTLNTFRIHKLSSFAGKQSFDAIEERSSGDRVFMN
ncbi:hypothetical protein CKA32_001351 [Geitlerinema sp. FC II]|nr:hypothetical protein CKA32_001351 [Geitlerinema sp. FC II]